MEATEGQRSAARGRQTRPEHFGCDARIISSSKPSSRLPIRPSAWWKGARAPNNHCLHSLCRLHDHAPMNPVERTTPFKATTLSCMRCDRVEIHTSYVIV